MTEKPDKARLKPKKPSRNKAAIRIPISLHFYAVEIVIIILAVFIINFMQSRSLLSFWPFLSSTSISSRSSKIIFTTSATAVLKTRLIQQRACRRLYLCSSTLQTAMPMTLSEPTCYNPSQRQITFPTRRISLFILWIRRPASSRSSGRMLITLSPTPTLRSE